VRFSRSTRTGVFVALVATVGAVSMAVVLQLTDAALGPLPLVVALGAAASVPHLRPLHVPRDGQVEDVVLEEAILPILLLLLPGGGVVVAAAIASSIGHIARRRPLRKCVFNSGAEAAALAAALLLQHLIAPRSTGNVTGIELVAVAVGVAAFAVVILSLVWVVMALATGTRVRTIATSDVRFAAATAAVGLSAGIVTGAAARSVWWAAAAGIPPLLAVGHLLGRLFESQRDRHRLDGLLRTLVGASSSLATGDVEHSVAGAARDLMRSRTAAVREDGPGEHELGTPIPVAGQERWLVVGGRHRFDPFDDSDRALLEGIAAMGTVAFENAALLDQVRHQALHDPLTGVPNRALFDDRLSQALERSAVTGGSVAVLYIDVDRFKRVNDSLGHGLGDELLQEIASRLAALLRPGDTAARIGGDEFAVLLAEIDGSAPAQAVADRLLDSLRQPFELDGRQLFVTASVGVAVSPQDGSDVQHLVRAADVAMYRAKRAGRDAYVLHTAALDLDHDELLAMETALHDAIRLGQLWVAYQPLTDTASRCTSGVEALVRWDHPELGTIPPDRFLPLAEEAGLIADIDTWVLRTAARQVADWRRDGFDLDLAVNLSSRSLRDDGLERAVTAVLAETGLPPSRLELEVTERVAAEEPSDIVDRLARLRELGVRVAIDDFGTGWSSLSRLDTFPVDRLKIDRSFVRPITDRHAVAPIVTASIALAHGLGLTVTAEGVETEEQLAFLRDHGCDTVQGWHLGRPVPASAFDLGRVARRPTTGRAGTVPV
jgi:diguanylate cyclase (GGDEF)-like protein